MIFKIKINVIFKQLAMHLISPRLAMSGGRWQKCALREEFKVFQWWLMVISFLQLEDINIDVGYHLQGFEIMIFCSSWFVAGSIKLSGIRSKDRHMDLPGTLL